MDPNVDFNNENISDEMLISIVRENPILYNKTLKEYKNRELKIELWKSIGETLSCTGEQAEGRWISLRNIFSKKLREMKAGQPSGSGCKVMKQWIYFKQMSFLIPYIAHRMSRSSMTVSEQEKNIASQNILFTEDSTVTISNPSNDVWSSKRLTCSDDNNKYLLDESLSTKSTTSDEQTIIILKDPEDNLLSENTEVQDKIADIVTEGNVIQKRKVVPALDRFAVKKQKTTDTIENVFCQSSHALNVMATAYLHRAQQQPQQQQPQQQQQLSQHPYVTAIAEAMKRVPDEQQLTCFMSIMKVISNHSIN